MYVCMQEHAVVKTFHSCKALEKAGGKAGSYRVSVRNSWHACMPGGPCMGGHASPLYTEFFKLVVKL